MSAEKFRELLSLYPKICQILKKKIYKYEDKTLLFLKQALKQIPYFNFLGDNDSTLYDIIYSFKTLKHCAGDILVSQGDKSTQLFFLEKGIIEVYITLDQRDFVLERLFRGSILNYRTFFFDETAEVNMRFVTDSVLKVLSKNRLDKIVTTNDVLE